MHSARSRTLAAAALMGLGIIASHGAQATMVSLNLNVDPLHTGDYLDGYYNGGFGSTTSTGTLLNQGPGPVVGFTFSSNADVQKPGTSAATGDGKFENNPSGQGEIVYFAFATSGTNTMNVPWAVASGFNQVSFNYSLASNSTAYNGQTVDIWSGLSGTGTLLDTITLDAAATTVNCSNHGDDYCTWQSVTASGFGTAESVTFGAANGNSQFTEFDGIQVNAVPVPAAASLLLSGLGALCALRRRHARPTA
jgi:hypothetical protein